MQAVVMRQGALSIVEAPIPTPGPGEVLVKTLACGICGSDLHCLTHGQQLIESVRDAAGFELFDMNQPVVMGHELCGEIVDYGSGTQRGNAIGTRVVSIPFLLRPDPVSLTFGTLDTPGGYAEYMVLSEDLLILVPDEIPDDLATLAEPLSVALHAVNRGNLGADDVPIVVGCGPIGLAVIAVLKMRGIGPIVAADFSPSRRAMAEKLGADIVIDPREKSLFESWQSVAGAPDPSRYGRQTQMFPGFAFRQSVIFECVGVPGIIQQIQSWAPPCSKIVVAGLCMEQDRFYPSYAIMKEIDYVFCIAYTAQEYAESFANIVSGRLQVEAMITGHVKLDGVADAFTKLSDPEGDVKIIVLPQGR